MTEYRHVYSDRGRLRYIPEHLPEPFRPRRGLFQGRPRRPHRIHIAHVQPDPTLYSRPKRQTTSKSYFTEKLAGPRENAKRYLRNLLDKQFASHPEPADIVLQPSSTNSNRASIVSFPESRLSTSPSEMRSTPRASGAVGSFGQMSAQSHIDLLVVCRFGRAHLRPDSRELGLPALVSSVCTAKAMFTYPLLMRQGGAAQNGARKGQLASPCRVV